MPMDRKQQAMRIADHGAVIVGQRVRALDLKHTQYQPISMIHDHEIAKRHCSSELSPGYDQAV
jgi:hypothetical protein